jgi:cobalt-zinc-cadmium efflux system protein
MNPHPNKAIENRFVLSMLLTFAILIAEVIGGFWTGSLALLSDAAHVFMDVFALGLSYLALRLSALPADDRHTYGFHRLEVIAALINGMTLGAIAIEIFSESWHRWFNPQPVKSVEMLVIAAIGLVVNLVVAFVLGGHEHEHDHEGEDGAEAHEEAEDLNVRSAFLHVVGDAVSSVGVIVAAGVIWFTGWEWVDPLMSVFIGILIVLSSWRVLKSSLHILVEGVPEHLSVEKIGASMAGVPGVLDVHDLHVWSICSGHVALSAHVITADQTITDGNGIMTELKARLRQFGIEHTTIQFECAACGQGSDLSVASSTSSSQIASL